MQAEPFVRAALAAVDEAGDPCDVRAILEAALTAAAPHERLPRPPNAKKRVVWAARQLAIAADQPARAYERLHELVTALWEPLATSYSAVALGLRRNRPAEFLAGQESVAAPARSTVPAPEVAAAMSPAQLIEALAPAPRVLAREIALTLKLDSAALLAARDLPVCVLGIRSIPQASIGKHAAALAAVLVRAADADVAAAIVQQNEAIAICLPAADSIRAKVVAALETYLEHAKPVLRARALDAMRQLKLPLSDERLAPLLHDRSPEVRHAATRSVIRGPFPPAVEMGLIARLGDDDIRVRNVAVIALMQTPMLHGPALVEPLREVVQRCEEISRQDASDELARLEGRLARAIARNAIYLLGRLGSIAREAAVDVAFAIASAVDPQATAQALAAITQGGAVDPRILATLNDAVTGPRSDAARAAAMVLESLGAPVPDVSAEARVVRAATELASSDRVIQRAGLFEAKRLGNPSLIPAIRALAERLAIDEPIDATEQREARALLNTARETLTALGVPADELPRLPSRLEPHRGESPREVEVHGAYAIGAVASALGIWDNGTGKRLFVVDGARTLAFVAGRPEVAAIRTAIKPNARANGAVRDDLEWHFERYAVPSGEQLGSIAVPAALTYGWPLELASAGDLVTVWCGDEHAPYRFHVKLGDPDRVIDETPVLGPKPSESRKR